MRSSLQNHRNTYKSLFSAVANESISRKEQSRGQVNSACTRDIITCMALGLFRYIAWEKTTGLMRMK